MEELKATMISVRWRNPERSWLIASMKMDGKQELFTATGDIPYSETEEPVQLYGEWTEDPKYGRQFKVVTSHRVLPTTLRGLTNYLAASEDIKGIGSVRASKLAAHFGDRLLNILDNEPERLSQCPGISDELAGRIADGWRKDSAVRQLSIFLAKYGVSPRWAGRILKQWDAGTAVSRITKNPYELTAIEGIGFVTADEIAIAMGRPKDSPERTQAACLHVLQQNIQAGNVFMHEGELVEEVMRITRPRTKRTKETDAKTEIPKGKAAEEVQEALNKVIDRKEIAVETVSDGFLNLRLLYLPFMLHAEKGLAERIAELNSYAHNTPGNLEAELTKVQETEHLQFSDQQRTAIAGVFRNHFMVITGGPGTGKTTCVRAVAQVADALHHNATLCAPTGRAAKRLSEVTGRDATTIHRLLKWRESGPTHRAGNPIDAEVLIVDEASMLDLELANALLAAVPDSCSVVFIGDVDQLPAVGAGSTLRDVIDSGAVPVVTLGTIFRQAESSLIIRNAHLIRKGEMPRFPEGTASRDASSKARENSYVLWIPAAAKGSEGGRDDAGWVHEKLARLVSKNIPERFSTGSKPIDPIKDVQVLVPMKKHTIGSYELNKTLQKALNPNGEEFFANGKAFRIGDRVMQTVNNYDDGMDVYNGDIGFVLHNKPEEKELEVDFYGRTVRYPYAEVGDLQLAYAQTIHKSQGSEYPVVVVVMGYQHWPMLERNLLYTANTRAKNVCLYVASKGAIERAVKNNPVKGRNTYLAQRIRAYVAKETANA